MLTVKSREGSVVHASWPAGVSKSTTTSIWQVRNLASIVVGKMLAASERHRGRAMAGWQGVKALEELFGTGSDGKRFGGPLLDGMAGGGGALCWRDGIDTGGHTSSLRATIANVESYELRYPILYLYRRQTTDSGGAGKFRGGAGVSMLYTVHGVEEIPTKILHTFGVEQPESPGMGGGYPSTTNRFAIVRESDLAERFARGEVPQSLEELEGRLEDFGAYAVTSMRRGDVYRAVSQGGGGYGDPLDRDPEQVALDVDRSLVSAGWAARVYGVLLDGEGRVDPEATAARREEIRAERLAAAAAQGTPGAGAPAPAPWDPAADGIRLNESLFYDVRDGETVRCRCGHRLGPAGVHYKHLAAMAVLPVQRIGPDVNPHRWNGDRFELREFYCPGCATLLELEIARPEDPLLADVELDLGSVRTEGL